MNKCTDFKQIKMVALDLDGTTLTRAGLTRRTKECLEECIERGIDVVIATGRPYVALPDDILSINGLKYIIISNGGHIVDTEGNILDSSCLNREKSSELRDFLMTKEFPVEVFTGGCAFVDQSLYDDLALNGSTYMGAKYILRTRKPVPNLYDFWLEKLDEIENLNLHFEDLDVRNEMWSYFESLGDITVTSSQWNNIELVGHNTSKANSLKTLCDELNINMTQVMAFGDSLNDQAMLEECGYAVAMGNADDKLKEIADFIAPTNEEEGVCYTIRLKLFNETGGVKKNEHRLFRHGRRVNTRNMD